MQKNTFDEIGLIGLGLVGTSVYTTLLRSAHRVRGYDLAAEKCDSLLAAGGTVADSPAEVGEHCRTVVISLLETRIVVEVIFGPGGLFDTFTPDRQPDLIIDTTTGNPDETVALERQLADCGVDYVDATISGSSAQISEREGVFLVGGRPEAYDRARPMIEVLSKHHYYVGDPGSGAKAKLVSNHILGLNRLVLAEGLVFAERLGLSLPAILDVLKHTPAYSVAMDVKGDKLLSGDYTPQSRISQHRKDLDIIQSFAKKTGQPLPLAALHRELLVLAESHGMADADTCAVIEEIRRLQK